MDGLDRLREDLINDDMGAFFGGGFGGALMESFDVENASEDELIEMARRRGFELDNYED